MEAEMILFATTAILLDLVILAFAGKYLYALWRRFRGLGEEE